MADLDRAVEAQVARVTDRLIADFAGELPDTVVRTAVTQAYAAYERARVTQFVPVLVDRAVRRELSARRRAGV